MSGDESRPPLDSRPWPELAGHLPILRALEAVGRERFGSAWRDDGPVPLQADGSHVRHPDGSIAFPPPGDVFARDPDRLQRPDGSLALAGSELGAARASWKRRKAATELLLQWLRDTPPDYPDALSALGWPDNGSPSRIAPDFWWARAKEPGRPDPWELAFTLSAVPGLGRIYVNAVALAEKLKTLGETAAAAYRTGLPGRPTVKPRIEVEAKRRIEAGEFPETLEQFSRDLAEWHLGEHPTEPQPTPKTIGNHVRERWNNRKPQIRNSD